VNDREQAVFQARFAKSIAVTPIGFNGRKVTGFRFDGGSREDAAFINVVGRKTAIDVRASEFVDAVSPQLADLDADEVAAVDEKILRNKILSAGYRVSYARERVGGHVDDLRTVFERAIEMIAYAQRRFAGGDDSDRFIREVFEPFEYVTRNANLGSFSRVYTEFQKAEAAAAPLISSPIHGQKEV